MMKLPDSVESLSVAQFNPISCLRRLKIATLRTRLIFYSAAGCIVGLVAILGIHQYVHSKYVLSDQTLKLIGIADPKLTKNLTYDVKTAAYTFNSVATKPKDSKNDLRPAHIGSSSNASDNLYSVDLPTSLNKGVTYHDTNTQLSFSLTPQFDTDSGEHTGGHVVYPLRGGQAVYTLKSNGVKEDIILRPGQSGDRTYAYTLNLPNTLEAKIIPNTGEVGIYSADPALYADMTYGTPSDQAKIAKAKTNAKKTYLVFGLPAPTVTTSENKTLKNVSAKFELSGSTLSVIVKNLPKLTTPISIDPTVVVTSSSDFQTNGNNETSIDFQSSGEIRRGQLTGGSIGAYSAGPNLNQSLEHAATVTYNGYVYVMGGSDRTNGVRNSVEYAVLNSDGSLGVWNTTTVLPYNMTGSAAVAYNGYMYMMGGGGSHTGTVNNDNFYAPINANGTLGSWAVTTNLPTTLNAFGAAVYNGYLYLVGGTTVGSGGGPYLNTVYYAPLLATGPVGNWTATTSFTNGRVSHSVNIINGYIYLFGGGNTVFLNDVQYAPINSDGSVGTWQATTSFSGQRYGHLTQFYNGYIYLYGGWSGGSNYHADTQYAPVYANGSIGAWTTTSSMSIARVYPTGAVYNGYLYAFGGYDGTIDYSSTEYAKIDPAGIPASFTTSSNTFTTTRRGQQQVAYNGYLYELGGDNGSTPTNTVSAAPLNFDGSVGTFTSSGMSAFPTVRTLFGAVAYNGYMYVLGGCTSTYATCSTTTNNISTVYSAPIATNGTIGTWTAQTSFNIDRYGFGVAAYNGYVYVVGGANGSTSKSDVQFASLSSSGVISSWATSATTIPTARVGLAVTVSAGVLYFSGGCQFGTMAACTGWTSDIGSNVIASSGDLSTPNFSGGAAFPNARFGHGFSISNGYIYISGGESGTGSRYSDTQYAPINLSGQIGGWLAGPSLPYSPAEGQMSTYNGNLYVGGGYDGTAYSNSIRFTKLNNGGNGGVNPWAVTGNTTQSGLIGYSTAYSNGYVYVLGGTTGDCSTQSNTVYYAQLAADGTLGAWNTTNSLIAGRCYAASAIVNGYLYITGGSNGSSGPYVATTEYTKINPNGTLAVWSNATARLSGLNQARSLSGSTVYDGHIYIVGGTYGSNASEVDMATPNAGGDITSWATLTSLPYTSQAPAVAANFGYIYVLGGLCNSALCSNVAYARLGSDGTITSSWNQTTQLPAAKFTSALFYNGYLYAVGGSSATTIADNNSVQHAAVSTSGRIGNWQIDPSLSTTSYGGVNGAFMSSGKLYLLNQQSAGSSLSFAALNVIPRRSIYSKLITFYTPEFIKSITYTGTIYTQGSPVNFKVAGSDGLFGNAASSATIASSPILCAPTTVSGAQYVLATLTLSDPISSQFPDNLNNPAAIGDFTVNALTTHPSPSSRLHLGKTLGTGTQSGLDTCGNLAG